MMQEPEIPEFDDDRFWELVVAAGADFDAFRRTLEEMSSVELVAFVWRFDELLGVLSESPNLPEWSEDSIEDLCGFVIGRGRELYEQVRNDPALMPQELDEEEPGIEIRDEAWDVYYERVGEPVPPQ